MRNAEKSPRNSERREEDGIVQRLGSLSPNEKALLEARLAALDPHDPDHSLNQIKVVDDTLAEIELARLHSQKEN